MTELSAPGVEVVITARDAADAERMKESADTAPALVKPSEFGACEVTDVRIISTRPPQPEPVPWPGRAE